jgi:hypothetical protein
LEQNKLVELLEANVAEHKKALDVTQDALLAEASQKDALFDRLLRAVRVEVLCT